MCGRFTLISHLDLIIHRFKVAYKSENIMHSPRYNIAPSQKVLAIVNDGENNRLGELRWGLIPYWAKDEKIGSKLINARAETLAEKPSFKYAFKRRRCLIVADGFYEWKKRNDGTTIPMRIQLSSGELFAFAGIWERWVSTDGEPVYTCAIITTRPNELVRSIHDRMPAILREEDEATWLDPKNQDPVYLQQCLMPYDMGKMKVYEVSTVVNSPLNDSEACIKPLE